MTFDVLWQRSPTSWFITRGTLVKFRPKDSNIIRLLTGHLVRYRGLGATLLLRPTVPDGSHSGLATTHVPVINSKINN
jgi:hypothetical protein